MARHLTKVYCRIRYMDGSEGPGYTYVCRDGWDVSFDGKLVTATFVNDAWEVQIEGDTWTAIIDKRTWRKLAKNTVPHVLRAENADDLSMTSAR